MPVVRLRGPLKRLAGDRDEHPLEAETVLAALRAIEDAHPEIVGWVLDERGHVRRHINVFVNGEQAHEDTRLGDDDRIEILPAITGGT
jgi:molybdopterin converting factor small subunit